MHYIVKAINSVKFFVSSVGLGVGGWGGYGEGDWGVVGGGEQICFRMHHISVQ